MQAYFEVYPDSDSQEEVNIKARQVLKLIRFSNDWGMHSIVDAIFALDREIRRAMEDSDAMPSFEYMEVVKAYIEEHRWHSAEEIVASRRGGNEEEEAPQVIADGEVSRKFTNAIAVLREFPTEVERNQVAKAAWMLYHKDYRDFSFIGRYLEVSTDMAEKLVEFHERQREAASLETGG